MPDRVILYIDAQNTYRGARETFCDAEDFHTRGQVDPLAIGNLICGRPPPGFERILQEVRVYTGRPDSTRQPRAYAAHMRQCAAWERAGVTVIPRTLRYPRDWPASPPREKGIDVKLAIDVMAGAIDGRYDVGVVFSTDTDLLPAIEDVTRRFEVTPRVETAAWRGDRANRPLIVTSPRRTWCHMLDREDFEAVGDDRDYNIG